MQTLSSSWRDGDELSFGSETDGDVTTYRLVRSMILKPSASAKKLDVKCQIDAMFDGVKVETISVQSNARNVEIYVAREAGTYEYARTVRGVPAGVADSFTVDIDDFKDAASVRLRMLSLRGIDKARCAVESFVVRCKRAHLSFELLPKPTTSSSSEDLQLDHLASIGTHMLQAAERRVLAHVDAACARLGDRFDAAFQRHEDRLDRIEQLLTKPS